MRPHPTPARRRRVRLAALLLLSAYLSFIPRAGGLSRTASAQDAAAAPVQGEQERPVAGAEEGARPDAAQPRRRTPFADAPAAREFDEWLRQYGVAGVASASEQDGEGLARRRRALMLKLAADDPAGVIELAVPARVRNHLPGRVAQHVEEQAGGYGDFLVRVADGGGGEAEGFTRSLTEREVRLGGKVYEARVYGRHVGMTTKFNIPLRGVVLGGLIVLNENPVRELDAEEGSAGPEGVAAEVGGAVKHFRSRQELDEFTRLLVEHEKSVGPYSPAAAAQTDSQGLAPEAAAAGAEVLALPWTEGPKTVLFMRVDFPDAPGEPADYHGPLTAARAQSLIDIDVNNFYKANSYNKTSLKATVTPVLRLPQAMSYYATGENYGQLLTDARAAAKAKGYDTANFNLDLVAFSSVPGFWWAGRGYVGAKGTWLNGAFDLRVAGHELGHNYGLWHASFWRTADGTPTGAGSLEEYGDIHDVMGGGWSQAHHFNTWFKNRLGWLPDADVLTVAANGTYQIQAYDSPGSAGRRALKIPKDRDTNYWVEFRQQMVDNNAAFNGAVLHWGYESNRNSSLLDMTPTSPQGSYDAALGIGQTFTDAQAGFSITAVRKVGTVPASLELRVNFTKPPLVSVSLAPPTVFGGKTTTGTVTIGAPAPAGGVTVSLGDNLAATSVPGNVLVPAGATSKTFTVTAWAVTAPQGGLLTATYNGFSKTAVINVVPPPALTLLSLATNSTAGGNAVKGTVTLKEPAPATGVTVNLSDNLASTTLPATVVVPPDASSADFTVNTTGVAAAQAGVVAAALGGVVKTAALTVRPVGVRSVSVSPGLAVGGTPFTCTVTLDRAPAANVVVTLSDNVAATNVPASIVVPAGAATKVFTIPTSAAAANQGGTLTATANGVSRSVPLSVTVNRLEVTNRNDSGAGSLRQAMLTANARPGRDYITFRIAGLGVQTITPATQLPILTDPVIIDGATQPGYAGKPLVELNGAVVGAQFGTHGLHLRGGNSVVRGLVINRFGGYGVFIESAGGNVVEGNYIGVNAAGTLAAPNNYHGVSVMGAPANRIGGTSARAANVISGNRGGGVYLEAGASGNVVQGNYVGVNAAGTAALPNASEGVVIYDAPDNLVGGSVAGARNVISGNGSNGVRVAGAGALRNAVQGNFIGTDAAGTSALPNNGDGILLHAGAQKTLVGGTDAPARNVISGNRWNGVRLADGNTAGNQVSGNHVGTNAAGTAALGNSAAGVTVGYSPGNAVGGASPGARNVISGNAGAGVDIYGAAGNRVQGNFIGTNAAGTSPLGNGTFGVNVNSAAQTLVGGATAAAGNVIAFNGYDWGGRLRVLQRRKRRRADQLEPRPRNRPVLLRGGQRRQHHLQQHGVAAERERD